MTASTVGMLVSWAVGLGWSLVAPRTRALSLGLWVGLLVLGLTAGLAGFGLWSVLVTEAVAVVLFGLGALAVEQLPRAVLVGVGALSLGVAGLPLFHGEHPLPGGRYAAAAGVLAMALLAWRRPRVALRLGCAALGARVCLGFSHPVGGAWGWVALTALLFVVNAYSTPLGWRPTPAWRQSRAWMFAFAPVLAVVAVPLLASPLPVGMPGLRLTRLKAALPAGGYLWPSLSEAAFWDDAEAFRAYDNLAAFYLAGTSGRGLYRLPGTHPIRGALIANRAVSTLRGVKDAAELENLSHAAQAIVAAVKEVLPLLRPGVTERQLSGALEQAARRHGCEALSFPSVVGSGPNGADAHARVSDRVLVSGELVVLDVGCDYRHYASDFTRTLPVGGVFTPATRAVYSAVYDAQQAALQACKAGATLTGERGMRGGAETLDARAHAVLDAQLHERGYEHALGHPVGLFVHDVGGQTGPLEPDMVVTLEPGDYRPGVLGVRIEDTYRVTPTSCEPLTAGFPADVESVEAAMR